MNMSITRGSLIPAVLLLLAISQAQQPGAAQDVRTEVSPGEFRIAGSVVSSAGGEVLPLTRVILRDVKDAKQVESVLTGDDGRFEFQVTAGKYSLHGAKRGFISADYDQHAQFSSAIVTGAGVDTEHLVLKLAPSATLAGKVLDESGDAVRRARVWLWREELNTHSVRRVSNDVSDDQGLFEFTSLDPGTYFLSVSSTPWYAVHPPSLPPENGPAVSHAVDRALDVVYPTTYYMTATESDDATPIGVHGGDRLELDLRVTAVPALHIIFRSPSDGDSPVSPPILRKRAFDQPLFEPLQENMVSAFPGVVEMIAAPGKYTVQFASQSESTQVNEVNLTQDHQTVDSSMGVQLSTIHAAVQVLGKQPLPNELYLSLRDGQGHRTSFAQVTPQGEAQFSNVMPGTYEIVAVSPEKPFSVTRVSSEGQILQDHTLKVPPGTKMSVSLGLTNGIASLEGRVTQAGKPLSGAMVVLVPKHPEGNHELFRRDQSDLDGSFLLRDIIPGTYTVVAISNGWELNWSQPRIISKYVAGGQVVAIPDHVDRAVHLPRAIEVQSK